MGGCSKNGQEEGGGGKRSESERGRAEEWKRLGYLLGGGIATKTRDLEHLPDLTFCIEAGL